MKKPLTLARCAGIICAVGGLLVAASQPAFALGEQAGTVTVMHGPAGSSGTVTWNTSSRTVTITTVAGTLPAGQCVTTWWDWYTAGAGHYDARAVRVCRSGQSATRTWSGENSRVNGLQKLGVCYGADNRRGDCQAAPGSTPITVSASFCNFTTASSTLKSNGSVLACSGGDPTKSTS
jgi:hypothetical protein